MTTDAKPTEYRGYLIYERIKGTCWRIGAGCILAATPKLIGESGTDGKSWTLLSLEITRFAQGQLND